MKIVHQLTLQWNAEAKTSENPSYAFRLMKRGHTLSTNDNECVHDYSMLKFYNEKILISFSFSFLINISDVYFSQQWFCMYLHAFLCISSVIVYYFQSMVELSARLSKTC